MGWGAEFGISLFVNVLLFVSIAITVMFLFQGKQGHQNAILDMFDLYTSVWVTENSSALMSNSCLSKCMDKDSLSTVPPAGVSWSTADRANAMKAVGSSKEDAGVNNEGVPKLNAGLNNEGVQLNAGLNNEGVPKLNAGLRSAAMSEVNTEVTLPGQNLKYFHTDILELKDFVHELNMLITDLRQMFCVALANTSKPTSMLYKYSFMFDHKLPKEKIYEDAKFLFVYNQLVQLISADPFGMCDLLQDAMDDKGNMKLDSIAKSFGSISDSPKEIHSGPTSSRKSAFEKMNLKRPEGYEHTLAKRQMHALCKCMSPRIKLLLTASIKAYDYMRKENINPYRLGYDLFFGCPAQVSKIKNNCLKGINYEYLGYYMFTKSLQNTLSSRLYGAYNFPGESHMIILTTDFNFAKVIFDENDNITTFHPIYTEWIDNKIAYVKGSTMEGRIEMDFMPRRIRLINSSHPANSNQRLHINKHQRFAHRVKIDYPKLTSLAGFDLNWKLQSHRDRYISNDEEDYSMFIGAYLSEDKPDSQQYLLVLPDGGMVYITVKHVHLPTIDIYPPPPAQTRAEISEFQTFDFHWESSHPSIVLPNANERYYFNNLSGTILNVVISSLIDGSQKSMMPKRSIPVDVWNLLDKSNLGIGDHYSMYVFKEYATAAAVTAVRTNAVTTEQLLDPTYVKTLEGTYGTSY